MQFVSGSLFAPTLSASTTPNNFAAQRREAMLKAIPRVALDGLDTYVAGTAAFAHLGTEASAVLSVGSGGLAAFHGICGIRFLAKSSEADRSKAIRMQALGYGEVITAFGYVGLAAGMGPWSLPLLAIGLATTNYARFA